MLKVVLIGGGLTLVSVIGIYIVGFVKTCQAWSKLLGDNHNDRSL